VVALNFGGASNELLNHFKQLSEQFESLSETETILHMVDPEWLETKQNQEVCESLATINMVSAIRQKEALELLLRFANDPEDPELDGAVAAQEDIRFEMSCT
jgi:hypothetical protein